MQRARIALVACLFALFSVGMIVEAEGGGRFDGQWAVFISGEPGQCQFGYRVSVRVRNGIINWQGHVIDPSLIGISPVGNVAIRLSDGTHVITGSGAIGARVGFGKWNAPAYRCGGRWNAIRL